MKPKKPAPSKKMRPCLKCGKPIVYNPNWRLCSVCRAVVDRIDHRVTEVHVQSDNQVMMLGGSRKITTEN